MSPADLEERSRIRGWARVFASLWMIVFGAAALVAVRVNPDNRLVWLSLATAALPGIVVAIWLWREPGQQSGGGAKKQTQ
jgi:hypothetical protein